MNDHQNILRENVLHVTFKALKEVGMEGVTIDFLARKVGISKKTLYRLFDSKEYILETALRTELDGILRYLKDISGRALTKMERLESSFYFISRKGFEGCDQFNQQVMEHPTFKYVLYQGINEASSFMANTYAMPSHAGGELVIKSFIHFLLKCASREFQYITEKEFMREVVPFYLMGFQVQWGVK